EAFQCPYAEQSHIARFSKHYFVIRLVTFRAKYRITDFSLNLLLRGGREQSFSTRGDAYRRQDIRRQPGEFRSAIHQRRDWSRAEFLAFGIASDDVDLECAHVLKITCLSSS